MRANPVACSAADTVVDVVVHAHPSFALRCRGRPIRSTRPAETAVRVQQRRPLDDDDPPPGADGQEVDL
jgi:hypothetical protein